MNQLFRMENRGFRQSSGSYTTIAAVLTDWRREKASESRAQTPEPPDSVRHLTGLCGVRPSY